MDFSWIFGVFLFINPANTLTIVENDETIAEINREDIALQLPGLELLDPIKSETLSQQINEQIKKPPENASISDAGSIIPEKIGHRLNEHAFMEKLYEFYYKNGPGTFEVPKIYLYPKVDSELLSNIRTKRIGQYITYYNSYNKSRSHNIALAVQAINNYVVFPGEIFSFNKVVGQRTVAKGYQKAPEIVRGETIEGIGGGICQVSSTLFNAVDRSGVTITERYSHSKRVPYVPPGRDATVSWYGPDFAFKNEYNLPILIRARAFGGQVVVFIYSSEDINYHPRNVRGILQFPTRFAE